MGKFAILKPTATRNYITNPSFENGTNGWFPACLEKATFEDQMLTPNPTGFDSLGGTTTNLAINSAAAMRGNYGLEVTVNGVGSESWGAFTDPDQDKVITLEFWFDPNNIFFAANLDVFNAINFLEGAANRALFFLQRNDAKVSGYVFQGVTTTDGGGNSFTAEVADILIDGPQKIRIEWKASSAPGANDGFMNIFVNETLYQQRTGIDNDTRFIDEIRVGAYSGVDAGTVGSLFYDDICWTDSLIPFYGCSIDTTKERAQFGTDSLKVYTDGNSIGEGPYFRVSSLAGIDEVLTASAYVRGTGKIRIRLYDGLTGRQSVSQPIQLHDDWWQRIDILGRSGGSNDMRVYIETAESSQEVVFYVDGVQLEALAEPSTYCDGDQEGCRWEGVFHASESTRPASSAAGGAWIPLDDDEQEIYVTVAGGVGVGPIRQNFQRMAQTSGGFYDNTAIDERVISLTIWCVPKGAQDQSGNSLKLLHELRQTLIDLFKPDAAPNFQELKLRYTDNGRSLFIGVRYEAGLDFSGDLRNKWTNTIPLRLLALQPYWEEDDQEVALLEIEKDFDTQVRLPYRKDGEWFAFPIELTDWNGWPEGLAEDPDGRLYMGGNMTYDNGGATSLLRFGYMSDDFSEFIQGGAGVAPDLVESIATHPNGKVYFGGLFTQDGNGNVLNLVAEYDPATDTINALGGGMNTVGGQIVKVVVGPNGWVYFGGVFDDVDGNAWSGIAYWDGGSWHALDDLAGFLGVAALSLVVQAIVVKSENEVYVGLDSSVGGILCKWDGSAWSTLYTSADTGAEIRGMIEDVDGSILAVGKENQYGKLWRWNGSSLTQLGDNFENVASDPTDALLQDVKIFSDGLVVVGGDFDFVGAITPPCKAVYWNGSSFAPIDYFSTSTSVEKFFVTSQGDLYLMGRQLGPAGAGITYVKNIGTADTPVIVTLFGSGKAVWLENVTTGQRVYMNYTLESDETLELDFRDGVKTVKSNYRGNVPNAILPNSDDLELGAGKISEDVLNKIALLIVDEVTPVAQLRYTPRHWSIDGVS